MIIFRKREEDIVLREALKEAAKAERVSEAALARRALMYYLRDHHAELYYRMVATWAERKSKKQERR